MKINPLNVRFVLVEPQTAGNIGAAARAIKTMGFERLVLVNPCDYRVPQAGWLAHASEDILEKAAVVNSLPEALQGTHFAVATTQRIRDYHFPHFTPAELAEKVARITQEHEVAVIFGRENAGLNNEELRGCHAISTIPAAVNHPSLNLAQAVMIFAYEFFKNSFEEEKRYALKLADYQELETVYEHLQESLQKAGFIPRDDWEKFLMRFKRLFGRAQPEKRDVRLIHKILQTFENHIASLEKKLMKG